MTYVYCAYVQASFTPNTDTLAIEIDAPANVTLRIRKIRIMHGDGTATTSADYHLKTKIIAESVAGTGGSSYTPIPKDQNGPASVSTVKTALTAVGTIDKTFEIYSKHSTTDLYWQASDEDDQMVVKPGNMFGIVVNPAN